ncbi:transketolase C-terminal domain-containing protein [Kribbella sp. NPDC050241]|uniref:transketolase C-terminal domain-containing protein n=1 Tax=Kribbella sp. NPDC050241 TaxID=3364115 RepID=UPI0037A504F4
MTTTSHRAQEIGLDTVAELAAQLRVDSIRSSTAAGSGHPTSSMSAADLLAVLVTRHLHYDWDEPDALGNDHLIFSKGHASPLLYSVFKAVGVVGEDELMTGYRRFGQRLQGHPTPVLPWVDVATGSLGQGLPDGVGIALAGKYLDRLPYRVWVLCGDSELAEGSIWEALDKASYYGLSNLTAIVDVNRLGQRGPTALGWNLDAYARRTEAFGARVLVIDGHDLAAATGLAVRGYRPFASTFAAFLTRAYDFIRMGAISGVDLRLVGSHAGVEIGADGPSQMALEDLAMLRAVHGSTVLYPDGEAFPFGGAKVLRSSDHDDVTLVGAGVTVHASLRAAEILLEQGIHARVIDCYSVKPIDTVTLAAAAIATAGRIVVAEDHHPEGGLGSTVTDALLAAGQAPLSMTRLAVRELPGSGSGAELLAWAGLDADHIAVAARNLIAARRLVPEES